MTAARFTDVPPFPLMTVHASHPNDTLQAQIPKHTVLTNSSTDPSTSKQPKKKVSLLLLPHSDSTLQLSQTITHGRQILEIGSIGKKRHAIRC